VIEKSYAMDMTANNGFRDFTGQIEALTDEKNGSLSRKAKATLERLERGPEPAPPPPDDSGETLRPAETPSPAEPAAGLPDAEAMDAAPPSETPQPSEAPQEPAGENSAEPPATPAASPN
jgi:hypothetical protein